MNLLTPFLGFPNPFTSSLPLRFTTSLLELPRSIYFLFTSYYFCESAGHYSCYFGLLGLLYYFSSHFLHIIGFLLQLSTLSKSGHQQRFFFFFFLNYVFWYCVSISHHKVLSLPFIALVKFWFELILSFFFFFFFFCGNRNLSFYQNTVYMAMNLNMPTNCLKF